MSRRVGLLGWNGRLNAGDDAMSVMICEAVRAADPQAELRSYGEGATLPRRMREMEVWGNRFFNLTLRLPGVRAALFRKLHIPAFLTRDGLDLLIIGGGSILKDRTTITLYRDMVRQLKARNPAARVLGFGLSVGPFSDPRAEASCQQILAAFDAICVREARSEALVKALSPDTPVHRHADPAFHQFRRPATAPAAGNGNGKTHLGLMLRSGAHEAEQAHLLDWLARLDPARYRFSFISFCAFHKDNDAAFARTLQARLQAFEHRITDYDGDLDRLAAKIAGCDMVLSVRLHGMIHALCLDKPVMYLPYHAKLDDIAAHVGLPSTHRLDSETFARPPEDVLAHVTSIAPDGIDALASDSAAAARHIEAALA